MSAEDTNANDVVASNNVDIDSQIVALFIEVFEGHAAAIATLHYALEDLHLHPHRQSQFSINHDLTFAPTLSENPKGSERL